MALIVASWCAAIVEGSVAWSPSIVQLPSDPSISTPHSLHRVNYGKYYSYSARGAASNEANTYYVFTPGNGTTTAPVVVEYHGGGFTGGKATSQVTAKIEAVLQNGIAWASMDYRLVATKYYFATGTGEQQEEEFIHAAEDGRLTLDTSRPSSSYKVRIGRQEFNTKCSYDAAAGFDDLISRAPSLGLDMHRVAFTGGSAGGGEIHYLSWVYPRLDENWKRYTPVGMVYTMAQLDYPVQNILDRVWGLWADDVGADVEVTSILSQTYTDCEMCIGNPWCGTGYAAQTELCNASWHAATMSRYCGDAGEKMSGVTLGTLRATQTWPNETAHDRGLARLWYNSINMVEARADSRMPKTPFHLYVANTLNGTQGMNVVHNALYARRYAEFAQAAGINYTVYYPDYHQMRPADVASTRLVGARGMSFNYRSSHDWRAQEGVSQTAAGSPQEQTLFFCYALGVAGCNSPPPAPPSPPYAPLTPTCEEQIHNDCSVAPAACGSCVRQHAADLMGHGCPPAAQGGFARCVAYCQSEAEYRRDEAKLHSTAGASAVRRPERETAA